MYRGRKGIFEQSRHICWTGCSALFFVWIITDVDNEVLSVAESVSEDDLIPDNRQLVVLNTYDPDKENTVSQKSVKNGEFYNSFSLPIIKIYTTSGIIVRCRWLSTLAFQGNMISMVINIPASETYNILVT